MIAELTLPRLGETMETGRVVAWLKQPGDRFRRGETLVEIETDKTIVEMPALADGVLAEIVIEAGQDADVGAVLCRYEDGLTAATHATSEPDMARGEPGLRQEPAFAASTAPPGTSIVPPGVRATPLARAAARRHDVALENLVGTGRRGRIEAADVHAFLQAKSPSVDMAPRIAPAGGRIATRSWAAAQTSGPRIVLLHGLAGDVQGWAGLAAALMRAGRHVTAVDLPGHGSTSLEAPDLETMTAAVAAFLDEQGGDPVELAGHSLGGAVAARVARRVPSRVRRLTLLAPAGLDREIDVGFIRDIVRIRSAGALQHLLRRLVVRPATLTAAQIDALVAELSRGRLVHLADDLVDDGGQRIDITGDLRALAMPVRVVWGMQDRIIPWTQVSQVGSRSAIHLIQDAGHVPHWDQPTEIAALFE